MGNPVVHWELMAKDPAGSFSLFTDPEGRWGCGRPPCSTAVSISGPLVRRTDAAAWNPAGDGPGAALRTEPRRTPCDS